MTINMFIEALITLLLLYSIAATGVGLWDHMTVVMEKDKNQWKVLYNGSYT
jgi:hypothetical protein